MSVRVQQLPHSRDTSNLGDWSLIIFMMSFGGNFHSTEPICKFLFEIHSNNYLFSFSVKSEYIRNYLPILSSKKKVSLFIPKIIIINFTKNFEGIINFY